MNIEHDKAHQRFVVRFPDGLGELRYRELDAGRLDFFHTEVTPALRDRGIGGALAEAAVAYAAERNMQVVPSCPFVRRWIELRAQKEKLEREEELSS